MHCVRCNKKTFMLFYGDICETCHRVEPVIEFIPANLSGNNKAGQGTRILCKACRKQTQIRGPQVICKHCGNIIRTKGGKLT